MNPDCKREVYRGRIAPTPSGLLHIGHARTFAAAAKRARQNGGTLVLRIEDIDAERCKPEYVNAAVEDLKLAGFQWDEGFGIGGKYAPYIQSQRFDFYKDALLQLIKSGAVYPSDISRNQIKNARAQTARKIFEDEEDELLFPVELRNSNARLLDAAVKNPFTFNWRFRAEEGVKVSFADAEYGAQEFEAQKDFGDFLVWRKNASPAYELAVCVDDALMEISEVVRGADLLVSTARQILVYNALKLKIPQFCHCPLMRGNDGKKLSKSSMCGADAKKFLIRNSPETARSFLRGI